MEHESIVAGFYSFFVVFYICKKNSPPVARRSYFLADFMI